MVLVLYKDFFTRYSTIYIKHMQRTCSMVIYYNIIWMLIHNYFPLRSYALVPRFQYLVPAASLWAMAHFVFNTIQRVQCKFLQEHPSSLKFTPNYRQLQTILNYLVSALAGDLQETICGSQLVGGIQLATCITFSNYKITSFITLLWGIYNTTIIIIANIIIQAIPI